MSNAIDTKYEELLAMIMHRGNFRPDRTGTGTVSLFGTQLRYNMANGFPLITTKNVHMKSIVGELLWFLSGSTSAQELEDEYGVTIWREWADNEGDLGPVYGAQWRNFGGETVADGVGVDQIAGVIESIKSDPFGRRHIVTAWNPNEIPEMALAPCHMLFQFYVEDVEDSFKLSLSLTQRSADMFLGVPFNIASYALLLHMVAQQVGMEPGELIWNGGDTHIYSSHFAQVRTQLSRDVKPFPTLKLAPAASIFDYTPEHVVIEGYTPHPSIKAPVAV